MPEPIHRHTAGVFVIAATPFTEDGALDLASTDRMVEFYLRSGATGLTILGIMGEAPKLSPEEARAFAGRVMAAVAGRVPVIVGVSAAGLDPMRALSHEVMGLGAAGVMVAPIPGARARGSRAELLRAGLRSAGARRAAVPPGLSAGHRACSSPWTPSWRSRGSTSRW